jgi:hypothetical protein
LRGASRSAGRRRKRGKNPAPQLTGAGPRVHNPRRDPNADPRAQNAHNQA